MYGLEILGFKEIASEIFSKWSEIPLCKHSKPVSEYQYAYPDNLLEKIAKLIHDGLKGDNFFIANDDQLDKTESSSIIKILNDAWSIFWERPDDFRDWELERIGYLRKKFL